VTSLPNKTALVTGAARGTGRATAFALASLAAARAAPAPLQGDFRKGSWRALALCALRLVKQSE
jgi:NAD(P)-dependent dehydrogenase (short-subunit alcohol dehydrogenase family)